MPPTVSRAAGGERALGVESGAGVRSECRNQPTATFLHPEGDGRAFPRSYKFHYAKSRRIRHSLQSKSSRFVQVFILPRAIPDGWPFCYYAGMTELISPSETARDVIMHELVTKADLALALDNFTSKLTIRLSSMIGAGFVALVLLQRFVSQ